MAIPEDQIILRVPPRFAEQVKKFALGEDEIDVVIETLDDTGSLQLRIGDEALPAALLTLPCIVESYKMAANDTNKMLYKSSDISRIIIATERDATQNGDIGSSGRKGAAASSTDAAGNAAHPSSAGAAPSHSTTTPTAAAGAARLSLLPTDRLVRDPSPGAGPSDLLVDSGLTPPTTHIVTRRFRRAHRWFTKHSPAEVKEAERVLLDLAAGGAYEHVVEELVEADPEVMGPWFGNGADNVTIVYEDGSVVDMFQAQAATRVPATAPIVATLAARGVKLPAPVAGRGGRFIKLPARVVRPYADGTFPNVGAEATGAALPGSGSGVVPGAAAAADSSASQVDLTMGDSDEALRQQQLQQQQQQQQTDAFGNPIVYSDELGGLAGLEGLGGGLGIGMGMGNELEGLGDLADLGDLSAFDIDGMGMAMGMAMGTEAQPPTQQPPGAAAYSGAMSASDAAPASAVESSAGGSHTPVYSSAFYDSTVPAPGEVGGGGDVHMRSTTPSYVPQEYLTAPPVATAPHPAAAPVPDAAPAAAPASTHPNAPQLTAELTEARARLARLEDIAAKQREQRDKTAIEKARLKREEQLAETLQQQDKVRLRITELEAQLYGT